jgi:glycosyltransferase involved in cell wall biosynthesis
LVQLPLTSPRVHLIEPHSSGRISGGYLYNQRLAGAAPNAIRRHAVRVDTLERDLAQIELDTPALLLADSLFLKPALMAPFLALRRPGLALGVLMHAFPSFIERAGDRGVLAQSLPLRPTPDELALLDQLDLLVAPGPYVPRLLTECGARLRTLVCAPGRDEPLAVPSTSPVVRARDAASATRIISVGNVTPLKGLLDGLQALAGLASPAWRWTIVGDLASAPLHVADLRQQIAALGLAERVELAGQRDHAATLALLRQSDVLLLPSYTENHPLVALEALAAGVPVIGYAVGGLPDIVRHEQTGLLAPLLEVAALTRQLGRWQNEPATRRQLARACLAAAPGFPSWEASALQLLDQLRTD